MTGYLDWALSKLNGAPAGACAFWIDQARLLSRSGANRLHDTEIQSVTADDGKDWQVVRFRANPFPARQLLSAAGQRTVVWCVGMPDQSSIDLTAFEDFFGRTFSVVDVSLEALAAERAPDLEIPRDLGGRIAGIDIDLDRYLQRLQVTHRARPLNLAAAVDAFAGMLVGRDVVVVPSDAPNALASVATAYATATTPAAQAAVKLAVVTAAVSHPRLREFLENLAGQEPSDVAALAYVAVGMARLGVPNVGPVLVADGWLSTPVRTLFDAAGGSWNALPALVQPEALAALAAFVEPQLKASDLTKLREALTEAAGPIDSVCAEPLPGVRIAALSSRFREFVGSSVRASGPGRVTEYWAEELEALDLVAEAMRRASTIDAPPEQRSDTATYAEAFARSSACDAHLRVARARHAFRSIRNLLAPAQARAAESLLDDATSEANRAIDSWDEGWRSLLDGRFESFVGHRLQGWQLSRQFADGGARQTSWLLVFDGLRYDLWRTILAPELRKLGWRAAESDIGFAFLPSITEVSRRTVIAGSREAARGQEELRARALAERASSALSYMVRTELFDKDREDPTGWNVRVFSWPDKLVHSDIADLGTLAAQFEGWVKDELLGWFKLNIKPEARVVITTDHGFAELGEDRAVAVTGTGTTEERNLPRVAPGAQNFGAAGLAAEDAGRPVTLATSRTWFRAPGARRWRFAHGGSSLHEVVVPFANLAFVREDVAEFVVEGLPATIAMAEDDDVTISFAVTVTGGAEMFPTVTVTALTQLLKRQIQRGETTEVAVTVRGEEKLNRVLIRVQAGRERKDFVVPVTVKLARIRREVLDFDI